MRRKKTIAAWRTRVLAAWCFTMVLAAAALSAARAQTPAEWNAMKADINMLMVNDMGRNGYYEQKPIADLMGRMATVLKPKCVLDAGDTHHFNGIASVNDPLWLTNYEWIYAHPELMIDWFPVMGNHEYRGNTQAVLDYAKVSRRWMMPARYYTKVFEKKGTTVRVVFLDTTPLIDRYRVSDTYPDARKQDIQAQLDWLDATLKNAREDWVIVMGHHPVYAYTPKDDVERKDMQRRVLPILNRYRNVDIYACGHIHNFQHIRHGSDRTDFVVNGAAALGREVKATDGTRFCSPTEGFSVFSVSKKCLRMFLVDKAGHVIHTVERNK